jgi:hypothetical protein
VNNSLPDLSKSGGSKNEELPEVPLFIEAELLCGSALSCEFVSYDSPNFYISSLFFLSFLYLMYPKIIVES